LTSPVGRRLPRWLAPANRVVILLNKMGLALGAQWVLSIPGRRTGLMRATPVSLLQVDGARYVVTGFETQWVKNARASGWGTVQRGRHAYPVVLRELLVDERAPILREFPVQVPHGTPFFERLLGLPADPDAFAAAADRCPVFRLDSWHAGDKLPPLTPSDTLAAS